MTHSPVYYDGHLYVTQVAHVEDVNELIDPENECPVWGLLEYSLRPGDGMLRVHDIDDDTTYEVHTVEDWEGLDKSAVQALLDAVDGTGAVRRTDEEYIRAWKTYLKTGDPEEALTKHKIGTVVRIDYGNDSPGDVDIALKIDDDAWIMSGVSGVWVDDEIEEHDYEVIYSV